jgi:hypothetical protein
MAAALRRSDMLTPRAIEEQHRPAANAPPLGTEEAPTPAFQVARREAFMRTSAFASGRAAIPARPRLCAISASA